MTTDQLAALTRNRPAHINPQWWNRASWRARQQAIDIENRRTRETEAATLAEQARIAELRAGVEHARRLHIAQYGNVFANTPPQAIEDDALDAAGVIEAVEQFLDAGVDVHTIASKLGFKIGALEMRLRRANRPDLANPFSRERNRMRKKHCHGCDKLITASSRTCKPCSVSSQRGAA